MDPRNSATDATSQETKKKEKEALDLDNIMKFCMYKHMKKTHQKFDEYDEVEAAACERYMIVNGLLEEWE